MTEERDNQEPNTPTDGETTTVRTQAAFVNKLYKMLEDNSIKNLITWSDRGDLFSVANPTSFSKSVLPQYFKHNNWQSFVRQLNMYGFHKVNDMIHSNLTSDNQTWEFKHPHFRRGEIEELQNIKRKSTKPAFATYNSSPSRASLPRVPSENDDDIYGPMYKHVLHIEDRLHHVTKSYEILKNETNSLKTLLTRQQETISDFAVLLSDILEGSNGNISVNPSRKAIISRLNDLQTLFVTENASQESLSSSSQQQNNIDSPLGTRSFEQFLSSQQQYQYKEQSYSGHESPDAKQTMTHVNRRMGFGKESHLLNPEPNMNNNYNFNDDKFIKKRRTD